MCGACGFIEYANSVPAVQALIERDGCILLARRAIDPGAGLWDLPGGILEEDETPVDGLRREIREETGLEIELVEFVDAVLDPYDGGRLVLGLTWRAHPLGGEPVAADDVAELAWFAPAEIPGDDAFAFASHPVLLAAWRQQQA